MKNFLSIAGPCLSPDNDPANALPASGANPSPPVPLDTRRKIFCEFCECQLTSAGEVMKFSDKAKGFRATDERDEKHAREIAALNTELETLRREKREREAAAPARRSVLDGVVP